MLRLCNAKLWRRINLTNALKTRNSYTSQTSSCQQKKLKFCTYVRKLVRKYSKDPSWYNKQLKQLKNIRNKTYKKCKRTGNFDSYNTAAEIAIQFAIYSIQLFVPICNIFAINLYFLLSIYSICAWIYALFSLLSFLYSIHCIVSLLCKTYCSVFWYIGNMKLFLFRVLYLLVSLTHFRFNFNLRTVFWVRWTQTTFYVYIEHVQNEKNN